MNKTKTIWWVVGVVVVVAIIFGVWHSYQKPAVSGVIKIGSVLSMTGDFAQFGEAINQGAILAVDEAKTQGINVDYNNQDDQSTAAGSANAANTLIGDNVSGVLTATVQEVKPMVSVFSNSTIPVLAVWDSNDYIKTAGPNIFTIGFSTEDAGQKMATYLYSTLGIKTAAVLSQQDEWSELIASAFSKKFQALGGTVSFNEDIIPTQKDFRTELTKIKSANVGAVYFPFLPGYIAPFLVQAKQLQLNMVFATGDSMSPDEVTQANGAAEGLYFTNLYSDNGAALAQKYQTKYGTQPGDPIFVSMGYDGMKTLIAAAEIAQQKNISMPDALRQVNIQGTDYQINFQGKQYSEKYERLYKVTNGQFVEIQQ